MDDRHANPYHRGTYSSGKTSPLVNMSSQPGNPIQGYDENITEYNDTSAYVFPDQTGTKKNPPQILEPCPTSPLTGLTYHKSDKATPLTYDHEKHCLPNPQPLFDSNPTYFSHGGSYIQTSLDEYQNIAEQLLNLELGPPNFDPYHHGDSSNPEGYIARPSVTPVHEEGVSIYNPSRSIQSYEPLSGMVDINARPNLPMEDASQLLPLAGDMIQAKKINSVKRGSRPAEKGFRCPFEGCSH